MMSKIINIHVEIECSDDSVDKGKVADLICAAVAKKFKKVNGIIVYDSSKLGLITAKKKK